MKAYLLISSILLLSYVFGAICVKSHQPVDVRARSEFSDGRHVTFACLSYTPSGPDELLGLSFPTATSVAWKVQQFNGETVQKCHMVWREDGKNVRSMFEAFVGSHNHDNATDDSSQEMKYHWLVDEYGLSLYSFQKNDYHIVKSMALLQYIRGNVLNLLENQQAVSVLCMSKEASGHNELAALDSASPGDGVGWLISDFNKGTTQLCHVSFGHKSDALVFEAFSGSWNHDLSIWHVHERERVYYWILRDTGLFRLNFHTNIQEFIRSLPSD